MDGWGCGAEWEGHRARAPAEMDGRSKEAWDDGQIQIVDEWM
jgi:hypothetical protein